MEGSIDKNQSYFFLFEKEYYTMEQVRAFTLEECFQHCYNGEIFFDREEYDSDYAEEIYDMYITGEDADDEPWSGDGLFLHTRLVPGDEYICYELYVDKSWDLLYEPDNYEVLLNDGRKCFIPDWTVDEWGGIEFEDETRIDFEVIPTELLDELVQKTPLVRKVTLQQFEEDWYQQKAGYVAIRKIH